MLVNINTPFVAIKLYCNFNREPFFHLYIYNTIYCVFSVYQTYFICVHDCLKILFVNKKSITLFISPQTGVRHLRAVSFLFNKNTKNASQNI